MKIAIVILNYNSSHDCRKCIRFLQRQEGIETEIVVVDNCSRSDDRNVVERLGVRKWQILSLLPFVLWDD